MAAGEQRRDGRIRPRRDAPRLLEDGAKARQFLRGNTRPDLLKAGRVQVLLGQKYFGWGSESVRLLSEAVSLCRQRSAQSGFA